MQKIEIINPADIERRSFEIITELRFAENFYRACIGAKNAKD